MLFTSKGPLVIKKQRFERDFGPVDSECNCKVCRNYSRSYMRHLFRNGEILSSMLASYHNLYFLNNLVLEARKAIREGKFVSFKREVLEKYAQGV
jgi:queuine tRNA-ribosyltransferase